MSERTALEIAIDLDAASCSSFVTLEAAEALRQQHAEIERLKTVPMKYRRMAFNAQLQEENTQLSEKVERLTALNSALTAKGNAFVIENARQAEKIGRLTAEKFRRFNNEECWIYQRNGENHLGTLTCPVVISPEALLSMRGEISTLTAERDSAVAAECEACAVVCDELEAMFPGTKTGNTLQWAAERIRARLAK